MRVLDTLRALNDRGGGKQGRLLLTRLLTAAIFSTEGQKFTERCESIRSFKTKG